MNKSDLDFSRYVEVPDEWIEKALAIPGDLAERHESENSLPRPEAQKISPNKKPAGLYLFQSRRLAAAACVVLILGLTALTYFYTGNMNTIPSAVLSPIGSEPSQSARDSTIPTSASCDESISALYDSSEPTGASSAAEPSTETAAPTEATANTPTSATEKPTQIPTEKPTEKPTSSPTESPTQAPTEATEPIVNATEDVCMTPEDTIDVTILHSAVEPIHAYAASAKVYCSIYDSEGIQLGNSDLYSPSHRAFYRTESSQLYLYYAGTITLAEDAPRICSYVFYDQWGSTLAYGSITV